MMSIRVVAVVFNTLVIINKVNSDENNKMIVIERESKHPPFDPNVYEEVLDIELCAKQIEYLTLNDTHLLMTCKCF